MNIMTMKNSQQDPSTQNEIISDIMLSLITNYTNESEQTNIALLTNKLFQLKQVKTSVNSNIMPVEQTQSKDILLNRLKVSGTDV